MKQLLLLLLMCQPLASVAKSATIWPTIPFVRGADLCEMGDRRTRLEYMREMTSMATQLMEGGAKGSEALDMLVTFDALHDKNIELSKKDKTLEVTLETSLKAALDDLYRRISVIDRKIAFKHINQIQTIISDAANGQRTGYLPENTFDYLDYVAYGSFSEARECRGIVKVTVTLVDRSGIANTYDAKGSAGSVMSKIANKIFVEFQGTKFPSKLKFRNRNITILGAPNGSIGISNDPYRAQQACEDIGGRLPKERELESISNLGDWNGGVSIRRDVWAISHGQSPKVYHPGLMNPSPVRMLHEVNTRKIKYYCVR